MNHTINAKPSVACCQKCGKTVHEIGGYLERVNKKGVRGIFECRPSCNSKLSRSQKIISAIDGE